MQVSSLYLAASFIAIACSRPALAGEGVGAGHEIYQTQCSPCHFNQPRVNGLGPSLAGVAGRKAGSVSGFHFRPKLEASLASTDTLVAGLRCSQLDFRDVSRLAPSCTAFKVL
jgi:cytochrome c2